MSIDQLMDAIGELDDGYIEEFAEIKPPRRIWGYLSAAACIALLFTLALVWARGGHTGTIEPSVPYEKVIWAVQGGTVSADSTEQAKAGEIVITAQLGYALAKSKDPNDVFAVFVDETTGAAPEQIYEEFIKPLGIYEEYLDRRVIFATQEQVNGISSSERFGIVLDLAINTNAPVPPEPSTEETKPGSKEEHATSGPVNGEIGDRVNAVIGIVDMTEQKGIGTFQALELFYEDGKFEYYFPSVRSSFIYVQYADGTQKPIREALAAGDVTIADLDRYGIKYYKESPTKEPPVTEPPAKQPEITAPTQPKEEPTKPAPGTGNPSASVINIVDRVEREGLLTAQALELFYRDSEYEYYFPSIRSSMVCVEYTGCYIACSQGIHAKYLSDTVYLACYAKLTDGTYTYSKLAGYSPLQYATNQLKNTNADAKLKQLVVAMLNYSAAAQTYFGHNVENLANAALTAEQIALQESYRSDMVSTVASASTEKQGAFANNKGFAKRYPSISFEGAFCINYFFTPNYAPVDGITLYYWNAADFEAVDVLTVENASGSFKLEGEGTGEYRGDIVGIAAKNLSEAVYVAAVYSDGNTTWTSGVLGYSIGAYCVSQSTKGGTIADLVMATAVYGYHAKQYFN